MKKLLFIFIFIPFFGFSQIEEKKDSIEIKAKDIEDFDSDDKELKVVYIENIPLFPGCEEVEKSKQVDCFNKKLSEHIVKNFKYPKKAIRKNISGRVFVKFVINKQGEIENIQANGPHSLLEDEAFRIIKLLPKMKPGTQRGKSVGVSYAIPINFNLN